MNNYDETNYKIDLSLIFIRIQINLKIAQKVQITAIPDGEIIQSKTFDTDCEISNSSLHTSLFTQFLSSHKSATEKGALKKEIKLFT